MICESLNFLPGALAPLDTPQCLLPHWGIFSGKWRHELKWSQIDLQCRLDGWLSLGIISVHVVSISKHCVVGNFYKRGNKQGWDRWGL